jgi:tRNA (guanine37-N1)-methyltransferase
MIEWVCSLKGIEVFKRDAEKTKEFLLQEGLIDFSRQLVKKKDSLVFPLSKKLLTKQRSALKKKVSFSVVERDFKKDNKKPKSLKQALQKVLTKKQFETLISSFDLVGNIGVIDIPASLVKKQKQIAEALMIVHPSLSTVCKKVGIRKGGYRLQKVTVIAGKKTKVAEYKEAGCVFRVDIEKVFFSPRLAGERLRIAKKIKKREIVGAFFAGVGPFPLVFAQNSNMKEAVAIELNPAAYPFLKENIKRNKAEGIISAVQGDVTKVAQKYANSFDRIVMPMPKGGEDFLSAAFIAGKKKCVIHFYHFVDRKQGYKQAIVKIKAACKQAGISCRILNKKTVLSSSPSKLEVCIDFSISE